MRPVRFVSVVGLLVAAVGQATAPATRPAPVNPVVTKLNTLPKNLWPVDGETKDQRAARDKAVVALLPSHTVIKSITGKLVSTREVQVPTFPPGIKENPNRNVKPLSYHSMQAIVLDLGTETVWGVPMKIKLNATLDVTPEVGKTWGQDQVLTISGSTTAPIYVVGSDFQIPLGSSTLISSAPAAKL